MTLPIAIHWFQKDLRVSDNPAFWESTHTGRAMGMFILDESASHRLLGGASRYWLYHSLRSLEQSLLALNVPLIVKRGSAAAIIPQICKKYPVAFVTTNRRFELSSIATENAIARHCDLRRHNGNLLHDPHTLRTGAGKPYQVYTPFWRSLTHAGDPPPPIAKPHAQKGDADIKNIARLESEDFDDWNLLPQKTNWASKFDSYWSKGEAAAQKKLAAFLNTAMADYHDGRNRPDLPSTSQLSPHLRWGEISPRQIWHATMAACAAQGRNHRQGGAEVFLKEICWREFSYHLLANFPDLPVKNLRPQFDDFPWQDRADFLSAWQRGQTGYPIVDAGMRQLWQTGWMHNRVRMIAASFLIKHLQIDWRRGEEWFWDCLVDADSASNAASWQWVAGSGADAAPYFRIFNPILQGEKFDPNGDYVRRFVPELVKLPKMAIHQPWTLPPMILAEHGVILGQNYPHPIVDHDFARKRALAAYQTITSKE